MTAVESRLAATLAKHRMDANVGFCTAGCKCGWRAPLAMGSHPRVEHERHVAAVIASSDDLAVVELPKPDEHDSEGTRWVLTPGFGVQALAEGGVEFGLLIVGTADDALRLAGMSVAAAKAAEAVDRGE